MQVKGISGYLPKFGHPCAKLDSSPCVSLQLYSGGCSVCSALPRTKFERTKTLENVFLLDAARAGHMLGLATGLGLALCADVMALKSIFSEISRRDVWILRWLHRLILAGLALLWVSGLTLLHLRTGWEAANFSPKLITKLAIVSLLSVNALIIGLYALPCYAANRGRKFGQIALGPRLRLAAIAGVSLSCWMSALALGVFSQLKQMGFAGLEAVFVPVFLAGFAATLLVALFAARLSRLTGLRLPAPEPWPNGGDMSGLRRQAATM